MSNKELVESITQFVNQFKELLGAEAEIKCEISEGEDKGDNNHKQLSIAFEGEKLGYMIGNQGRHMDSLQFILSMMINKKFVPEGEPRFMVSVDVSGYKRQKDEKIEAIAIRVADDARILGEPVDMEPMNASERRVVHMILSRFDDIKTESFGEGEARAVRVIPISESELGVESFSKGNSEEADEESEE